MKDLHIKTDCKDVFTVPVNVAFLDLVVLHGHGTRMATCVQNISYPSERLVQTESCMHPEVLDTMCAIGLAQAALAKYCWCLWVLSGWTGWGQDTRSGSVQAFLLTTTVLGGPYSINELH